MSPPRIAIYVVFERNAPRVLSFWERDSDAIRMHDWLRQRPELQALVDRAVFLEQDEPGWEGDEQEWEQAA